MSNDNRAEKNSLIWLIASAMVIAGVLLIADAFHFRFLARLPIRMGIGLLFSAIALIAGKERPAAIISIAVVWIAILLTLLS
ncbi:MAG: hypothetical protein NTV06_07875 [candidate division Zixibacteria bacterium]|nr:hypothetical protein [candidate division Zixibacteria bacterium]